MSDLLKESIADAKAVRETALANAKTFLEENFAASMKQMFAEKLKEEMAEADTEQKAEGEVEEGTIEEKLSSSGIGGEKGNVASKQHPKTPSASANKTSTETSGEGPEVVQLQEEETEVTSEELDEILAELEGEVSEGEDEHDGEHDDEPGFTDEVVDLDELLAELDEQDAQSPAAVPAPAVPSVDPTQAQAPTTPAPAPAAPVAGQVPSPMEEDTYEEEVSVDELAEALIAINEENEQLKQDLQEHRDTVKYLKGVLNEANLLNAKLLYTNKLFKGKNLTEEQKLKVINTFDLTKNIREVKLAYTVLAESIIAGGSVAPKKKINATAQTITEGLASKPVSSTKPESAIVDPQASDLASRLQKLAGITK